MQALGFRASWLGSILGVGIECALTVHAWRQVDRCGNGWSAVQHWWQMFGLVWATGVGIYELRPKTLALLFVRRRILA